MYHDFLVLRFIMSYKIIKVNKRIKRVYKWK